MAVRSDQAALGMLAVMSDLCAAGNPLVIDIGGGSADIHVNSAAHQRTMKEAETSVPATTRSD